MVNQEEYALFCSSDNISVEVLVRVCHLCLAFTGDLNLGQWLQYTSWVAVCVEYLNVLVQVNGKERSLKSLTQLSLDWVYR